ncbi:MAG TPA: hypothetical protein PKA00_03610 [Saprospiraceae bacterium]|nr:hypothetical protein [Saprospiraceae bacterium]HMQ81964.1 hypothetical protein [Saprospiraceae bacterium]
MKMTKWLVLMAFALISVTVSAQESKAEYKAMKAELGLTGAQVKDLKGINENYKAQMQAVKADASLSDQAKREQLAEIRKSKEAEVKGMMSEEQYNAYKAKTSEMKQTKKEEGQQMSEEDMAKRKEDREKAKADKAAKYEKRKKDGN